MRIRLGNRWTRSSSLLVIVWWSFLLSFLAIIVSGTIIKVFFQKDHTSAPKTSSEKVETLTWKSPRGEHSLIVPVYLTQQDKMLNLPLEQYIAGVLAAEMPIEFELEALKAQAIVSRTYWIRRYLDGVVPESIDVQVRENQGLVTDTIMDQAYLTEQELKSKWGEQNYKRHIAKINQAVQDTEGLIITYNGEPINATFFSTSNGLTENSGEYWLVQEPYLRTVQSPWEEQISPRYKQTTSLLVSDVLQRLGLDRKLANQGVEMLVLERTTGQRIKKIRIAGSLFTGREVREKLELPSSHFEWKKIGDTLQFTTYGYGHGVGMSQWGAEGMAREGHTAEQIIQHYYTGTMISPLSSLPTIVK